MLLISVVIPTHNRPTLLAEAVSSIAEQTYRNYEVVVVDDGSAPPISVSSLEEILGQRIVLRRHDAARGVSKAKNAGIGAARGEVILLLDDDDLLRPHALEKVCRAYSSHPRIDCLFLGVQLFGPYAEGPARARDSALSAILDVTAAEERDGLYFFSDRLFNALLKTVPIDFQRPAARRGMWNIAGGFYENCLFSESAWAIRASCIGTIALTREPLTRWRIHDSNFGWPPDLSAAGARMRQMDNAVNTGAWLLETFGSDARLWRGRAKKINEYYSDELFSKAYYLRDKDPWRGIGALFQSIFLAPKAKHLRLMASYLLAMRWLERGLARGKGERPRS